MQTFDAIEQRRAIKQCDPGHRLGAVANQVMVEHAFA